VKAKAIRIRCPLSNGARGWPEGDAAKCFEPVPVGVRAARDRYHVQKSSGEEGPRGGRIEVYVGGKLWGGTGGEH